MRCQMPELTKAKMLEELKKKLQIVHLDLLTKRYADASREFFWVAVPDGQSMSGQEKYKEVDLAKEFPQMIIDFADAHNVKAYSTSKGYRFEKRQ